MWAFDDTQGGVPIYSTPTQANALKYDFRLSTRIYSFLAMISEDENLAFEWSLLPLLEERRAFCFGYLIDQNWVVLSLIVDKKHTSWLIHKTSELIRDFKEFFTELVRKEDLDRSLRKKLQNLQRIYKKEAEQH